MKSTQSYYKISDFADLIGKHVNTVDRWFNDMERRRIHYVNRSEDGMKIYDDQDLSIANFIRDRRDENWNLPAIYNKLEELFDLRPFPDDDTSGVPQVADFEAIRRQFSEDLRHVVRDEVSQRVEGIVLGYLDQIKAVVDNLPKAEDIAKQLPAPRDPTEERQQRITEMITLERVKGQLRKEALHQWSTKPESERLKRIGLFGLKKEEDHAARDRFVRDYVDDHLPERLAQEYGIDKL